MSYGYRFPAEFVNKTSAEIWKCANFCVCQVLEGGGRNLSPLFYDVG